MKIMWYRNTSYVDCEYFENYKRIRKIIKSIDWLPCDHSPIHFFIHSASIYLSHPMHSKKTVTKYSKVPSNILGSLRKIITIDTHNSFM